MCATKTTTRSDTLLLAKVAIVAILCAVALIYWMARPKWKVIATDEKGKPVAGLQVYVTYPSGSNPPMFTTGRNGIAVLTPKAEKGIHSLSLVIGNRRMGIPWRQAKWPLRVRVRKNGIEVIKDEK